MSTNTTWKIKDRSRLDNTCQITIGTDTWMPEVVITVRDVHVAAAEVIAKKILDTLEGVSSLRAQ